MTNQYGVTAEDSGETYTLGALADHPDDIENIGRGHALIGAFERRMEKLTKDAKEG